MNSRVAGQKILVTGGTGFIGSALVLLDMVRSGQFKHQLHVALIASALLHGRLAVPL